MRGEQPVGSGAGTCGAPPVSPGLGHPSPAVLSAALGAQGAARAWRWLFPSLPHLRQRKAHGPCLRCPWEDAAPVAGKHRAAPAAPDPVPLMGPGPSAGWDMGVGAAPQCARAEHPWGNVAGPWGGRAAWGRAQFGDAHGAEPGAAWSPAGGLRGRGASGHPSLVSAGRPLGRSFPRGLGCEEHQPAGDPSQHQHRRHQHQSAQPVAVHVSVPRRGGAAQAGEPWPGLGGEGSWAPPGCLGGWWRVGSGNGAQGEWGSAVCLSVALDLGSVLVSLQPGQPFLPRRLPPRGCAASLLAGGGGESRALPLPALLRFLVVEMHL